MPLTPAEKQRRYRQRRDDDEAKRQSNLVKDRIRWHQKKTVVTNMSEREHRRQKRKWKETKRQQRRRQKQTNEIMSQFSPPPTTTGPYFSRSGLQFLFIFYPLYLSEHCVRLTDHSTRQSHNRSATSGNLFVRRTHLKTYGQRPFSTAGPLAWNSSPTEIKSEDDFNVFKSKLKTHLFKLCYY